MNAVVAQIHKPEGSIAAFANTSNFESAQRIANALAASSLVPQAYRGKAGLPNVLIALELANRIGASPMAVMQNLHVIQGKPSWSSSFLIATVNACGRFSPMRFESVGDDPTAPTYRVRAYAEDKATGDRCVGPWVTWDMVKAEGWLSKSGSKWRTMPEVMFMYRAAAFWSRLFAPEISLGIQTSDEVADVYGTGGHVAAIGGERPNLDAIVAGEALPDPVTGADDDTPALDGSDAEGYGDR